MDRPVNVCTNSVFFEFSRSDLVNVGNAKSMFDELVIQCGGATSAIVGVSCTSAILNVTFRDNFAAAALVKRFQEKRTRHELSSNFKNCRVYFNLPADLQARRQALFREVSTKNASSGGQKFYVDEFDLTVKPCQNFHTINPASNLVGNLVSNPVSNSIIFNFSKSNLVNVENATNKFRELVILCGGSTDAMVSVNCVPTPKILIATFRSEESASTVLKRFQEKKLRDELSAEFKFCRICFNLSKELQTKRNNLYTKVNEKKACGADNLYVDEYDLTIKQKPGISLNSNRTGQGATNAVRQDNAPQNSQVETSKPVHSTNIVYFNFCDSNIKVEDAENKFRELVILCERSGNDIAAVDPMLVQKTLRVTFRSEDSASAVLKTFQDWKIQNKLSFELKSCYIYFHLPKHLQTIRNERYKDLRKTAGYGVENLYVDEYDLKIKKKPTGDSAFESWPGNSSHQSASNGVRQGAAHDNTTEIECPVCWNTYRTPKILTKCGHSICGECEPHIKKTGLNNMKILECPMCRQITELPVNEALPMNWTLKDFIESARSPQNCRIYCSLPKDLQEKRNNPFWKVEEKKAYGVNNLYDLTIKTKPAGTSLFGDLKVYNAVDHKQKHTVKDIPALTSSTPLKYSSEQGRASSEPFRIWYSVEYDFRYKHMNFHQFVKEVLGEYAKDVQMESETSHGFILSLKPTSTTSIQTLLKRLPHGVYLN